VEMGNTSDKIHFKKHQLLERAILETVKYVKPLNNEHTVYRMVEYCNNITDLESFRDFQIKCRF
jgi:hypothetical protein